uniref:Nose resistant-to-fluoxetine protein N-terminal domain-containing protein n=1 Tax=Globodera rostochiensis TaxID=31243 RepID=A0A914HG36_GLORO
MPSLSALLGCRWHCFSLIWCIFFVQNWHGFNADSNDADSAQLYPFHLTRAELLEIGDDGALDNSKYKEDLGQFMGQFFHDSDVQLMLDMDMFIQLWNELNALQEAATDGRVDTVQAVITFFEPLAKYDISAPCLADLTHFLWTIYHYAKTAADASQCMDCNCTSQYRSKVREFQWIFDVVDAIGKVPAAVVSGNNLWTGSWATCRKISAQKNRQGQFWRGQYCMARFQPFNRHNPLKAFASAAAPSDPTAQCRPNSTVSDSFENWSAYERSCFDLMPLLNLGLCTPDTCTDYDVRKLVQFIYEAAELSLGRKFVCNVTVQCSNSRPESQLYYDSKSMAVLCLLLAIGSLMLFGTFYDIYVHRPLERSVLGSGQINHNKNQQNIARGIGQSKAVLFIRLFSVARNLDYIMDTRTEEGQIRCLHGARFLSMCWIIFGHTYYYIATSFSADNLLHTLHEFPKFFYNQMRRWRTWLAYYGRRYLRLTPVYVLVMLTKVTVLTYISEGPFWRPIDPNFCRESWWANLLYIKNFVGQNDSCMGWTWYLANDFQLYAFAPILIIALHKYKMGGVVFGLLLLIASSTTNVVITLRNGYPPAPLLTSKFITVLADYWNDLYVKPYIRCGPYIVGCVVGYFLAETRTQQNFRMSPLQCFIGWTVTIVLTIYSIFGLYNFTKTGDISFWWSLLYTAFGRLAFALALGWTTFACETNHGASINAILGHKMFVPLSKITFSAYLLHPILLQIYYLSRPSAFHFTHSFQVLHIFFANVATSYACALLLSLAIEVPVSKIKFGNGAAASPKRGATGAEQQQQFQNGTEATAPPPQGHELKPLLVKSSSTNEGDDHLINKIEEVNDEK